MLTAKQIELLNDFQKTQPALHEVGVPEAYSGVKLGDILKSLEDAITALNASIEDLDARVTALETP